MIRSRNLRSPIVKTFAVTALAAATCVAAITNGSAATETPSGQDVQEAAELRAGYGLYAEPEYVTRLLEQDKEPEEGFEQYPIPFASGEEAILRRNIETIIEVGDWRENVVSTHVDTFTDIELDGSVDQNGLPKFVVRATDLDPIREAVESSPWQAGATVEYIDVKYSLGFIEQQIRNVGGIDGVVSVSPTPDFTGLEVGISRESERDAVEQGVGASTEIPTTVEVSTTSPTLSIPKAHVSIYGDVAAATWTTSAPSGGGTGEACHQSNVVDRTEGGTLKYFMITAQHCMRPATTDLPETFDGYPDSDGDLVLQSSGAHRYSTGDNLDVGAFQIPSIRKNRQAYMKYLNGAPLYRQIIGTASPVSGTSYCWAGQLTRTATYGFKCGTASTAGMYLAQASEDFWGWRLAGGAEFIAGGDSGTTIFLQLPDGDSRAVGVQSADQGASGYAYFGNVVTFMNAYSMGAY